MSPKFSSFQFSQPKFYTHFSFPHVCHIYHSPLPTWFNHLKNIYYMRRTKIEAPHYVISSILKLNFIYFLKNSSSYKKSGHENM